MPGRTKLGPISHCPTPSTSLRGFINAGLPSGLRGELPPRVARPEALRQREGRNSSQGSLHSFPGGGLELQGRQSPLTRPQCLNAPPPPSQELLKETRKEHTLRAVELLYSIFSLDMQQVTLVLLGHILPGLLTDSSKWHSLMDPPGTALAK